MRESKLPVGSSASSRIGWLISARATATRCCSPPESFAGGWCIRASSPTRVNSPRLCSPTLRRDRLTVEYAVGIHTFSRAVARGSRLKLWKTNPMRLLRSCASCVGDSRPISTPLRRYKPSLGRSRHPSKFIKDVLPDPEVPIKATNSPSSIDNETSFSTGKSTSPTLYALSMCCSSISGQVTAGTVAAGSPDDRGFRVGPSRNRVWFRTPLLRVPADLNIEGRLTPAK